MKLSFTQVYASPGVRFPFSYLIQHRLGREIGSLLEPSHEFNSKFGKDSSVTIFVSARDDIATYVIKGPTVFKKRGDIECTIFLPFAVIMQSSNGYRKAIELLLQALSCVLAKLAIDCKMLDDSAAGIVERICSDPSMLDAPWPNGVLS